MAKQITSIQPGKVYNLTDLARRKFFSWAGSDYRTYRRLVELDAKKQNMLKAILLGEGTGMRIKIKGSNATAFKESVEAGKYRL